LQFCNLISYEEPGDLLLFFVGFLFIGNKCFANENTGQVIRGKVVDKLTQMPLPGANVILLDSDPLVVTGNK
jgi:hypothetical protein